MLGWVCCDKCYPNNNTFEFVLSHSLYCFRADGACRHLAASLYALEAFEKKSVTDGENQWEKRPRHHDKAVSIDNLKIVKAKYVYLGKLGK
jgi:hypothetical protein